MKACAVLLLIGGTAQAFQLRIANLANEGVLLKGAGTRILMDALLRDSIEPYALCSASPGSRGNRRLDAGLCLATGQRCTWVTPTLGNEVGGP